MFVCTVIAAVVLAVVSEIHPLDGGLYNSRPEFLFRHGMSAARMRLYASLPWMDEYIRLVLTESAEMHGVCSWSRVCSLSLDRVESTFSD